MTIQELPKVMLICLSLTIIIEVTIAFLIKINNKQDLLLVLLVNVATNPLVVSISTAINYYEGLQARKISLIFLELFAVLLEAILYKKHLKRKFNPYLLSLILNGSSYLLGLLINMIIH